jgi:hypothetical protein
MNEALIAGTRFTGRGRAMAAMLLVASLAAASPAFANAQTDEPWSAAAPAPEAVRTLLLGLNSAESGIPYALRQRLLEQMQSIEVTGRDTKPDRYLRATLEGFGLIVRSFEGRTARDTVHLLSFSARLEDCDQLKPWLGAQDQVGRDFCFYDESNDNAQIRAKGARRFGFAAYRLDAKGKPQNVTAHVFPNDPYKRLPKRERTGVHNVGGVTSGSWVDHTRLSEVPVMRLYLAYGDGNGLPRSHPRAFSGGYPGEMVFKSHLGFLVWNGQRFDLRDRVERKLWPCTFDDSISASGRSCLTEDPDPFITR